MKKKNQRVEVYMTAVKVHGVRKTVEHLLSLVDELKAEIKQLEAQKEGYGK